MRSLPAVVLLILTACVAAPAPQTPTPPASPAGGAPTAGTRWDQVLADAHAEGSLVLDNAVATQGQHVLDTFQAKYPWLQLEVTSLAASQFTPRVLAEQRNGLYAWDLLLGAGFNNVQRSLAPADAVGDVRTVLTDLPPDVTDDTKWAGGFAWYRAESEKGPDSLVTDIPRLYGVYVNRAQIPASQLTSVPQLIDPQFKGKFVIYNPTLANAGSQGLANLMAYTDEAFITRILVDQAAVQVADAAQASQFLAQGRYPIALGVTPTSLEPFLSQGVGKEVEPLRDATNQYVRAGGFTLIKNAPHPNAIRVFLAWFLSAEGQETWNKSSTNAASRRLDVPVVNPDATPDYAHLNDYRVVFDTPAGDELLTRTLDVVNHAKQ
jgi:iron(III) transport system substrate-binding protein